MKIYIQQSQYSKAFSIPLSQARVNGIENIHPNNNSTGQWCWHVDLNSIDIEEIRNIPCDEAGDKDKDAFINMLISQMPVQCVSFDDFIRNLSDNIVLEKRRFVVEGDIVNGYYKSDSDYEYCMYDFLDKHDMRKVKKIFIDQTTSFSSDTRWRLRDCRNRRIKAVVEVRIDSKRAGLKLQAIKISDLGECSREAEYNKNSKEYEKIISRNECNRFSLPSRTPRIALICGYNHGMKDFTVRLHKDLCLKLEHVCVNMTTIADVVAAVVEVNERESADIICIVRGGGDAEDLCKYNNSDLLVAIRDSKIPVITGIGHADDKVLAQEVATYGAATPTAAAEFLNSKYRELCREDNKKWSGNKKENAPKADYDAIQIEYAKLLEEKKKLWADNQKLQEENQQLQDDVERLKKRSLFARIFNL